MNLGSWYEIIVEGTPCSLIISWMYRWVNFSKGQFALMGKKWADLVNLSTITYMELYPANVLGSHITKSIEILSCFHSRISKVCSAPNGFWCSIFTFWKTKHLFTNFATSELILGHQKILRDLNTSCLFQGAPWSYSSKLSPKFYLWDHLPQVHIFFCGTFIILHHPEQILSIFPTQSKLWSYGTLDHFVELTRSALLKLLIGLI